MDSRLPFRGVCRIGERMVKANIVVEDCYAGTVNVINIDKTGITYSVDDVACCYNCQNPIEGQQTLKWEDDGWYITDLWETEPAVNPIIYNFIVLLSEERGIQNLNDDHFKKDICDSTGLSTEAYDNAINGTSVITADEKFEEVREAIDGDDHRIITRAFGAYLKELDEAEEDRASGDPRREHYALTKEQCLEKAIELASA